MLEASAARLVMLFVAVAVSVSLAQEPPPPALLTFDTPTGQVQVVNRSGEIDRSNPFFQTLGTNGRTCETCHRLDQGTSITPARITSLFNQTGGTDPLFDNFDGTNCSGATFATTEEQLEGTTMLRQRGLIRITVNDGPNPIAGAINVPPDAEFRIIDYIDPFECGGGVFSVYRRVMPVANLQFSGEFDTMWDGREPGLAAQANSATRGHAMSTLDISAEQADQIASFELGLFMAQGHDTLAGDLTADGATGGAMALMSQPFWEGVNDTSGQDPTGAPFTSDVFTLFTSWRTLPGTDPQSVARRAIANGERLFNSVGCAQCHNTPNVGSRSVEFHFNHGMSNPNVARFLPVFVIEDLRASTPPEARTFSTTDMGAAWTTGKMRDRERFKVPSLRGLSARFPVFHNGACISADCVVQRYRLLLPGVRNMTAQEMADLAAFLRVL